MRIKSQIKAANSIDNGRISKEILPVTIKQKRKDDLIINKDTTPTCSIFVDKTGERTIVSSGYQKSSWNNFDDIGSYDSLMLDRYSIEFVKEDLIEIQKIKFVC